MLTRIAPPAGAVQWFAAAYRWEPGDATSYPIVITRLPGIVFGGVPSGHVLVSYPGDIRNRPPAIVVGIDEDFAPYVASLIDRSFDGPWVTGTIAALADWRTATVDTIETVTA